MVFKVRSKLFRLDLIKKGEGESSKEVREWIEVGIGPTKVLKPQLGEGKPLRLPMFVIALFILGCLHNES